MSEIARLLAQIDLEYEAAKRVLEGFAVIARHDFITTRYNNVGIIHDQLAKYVGEEEANKIVCQRYVEVFDGNTSKSALRRVV